MNVNTYLEHKEWALLDTSAVTQVVFYDGTEEPFIDVTYTIALKRRPERHVNTVLIPVFASTILAILTTLIPHHLPIIRVLMLFITTLLICFFTLSSESKIGLLGNLILYSYFSLFLLILHSILLLTYANTLPTKPCSVSNLWPALPDRGKLARLADFLVTSLLIIGFIARWSFVLLCS